MQHVEHIEIRVDRFRAFDMQHRRECIVGETMFDIGDVAADADAALRLPLDAQQQRGHRESDPLRFRKIDRRRVAGRQAGLRAVCILLPHRRNEDREQSAGKSALAGFD